MKLLNTVFALGGAVLLAACAGQQARPINDTAARTRGACESVEGRMSAQEAAATEALRSSIEAGPLYVTAAANEGVAACRIRHQPDGVIRVEYQFRDGGRLQVTRDASIEYTEQDARYALTPQQQPQAILAHAERAAFGADGCGIDWQHPETQPSGADHGATETIFRGTVCNCQARIRRDVDGRVVGLVLRSAC